MSRFEEYGLYAENSAFLASGEILTFTGRGGKLMALRPDVTLSIIKHSRDGDGLQKLYYNENVYRPAPGGLEFKERMQAGLECIGDLDVYAMGEVIMLASMSLGLLGGRSCLDISHMGYINGLLKSAELTQSQRDELLRRVSEKNVPELSALCVEYGLGVAFRDKITALASLYGPIGESLEELRRISAGDECDAAIKELEELLAVLRAFGVEENINIDFSIVNDMRYYSGVIFQGYIEGVPAKLLSGGRYDKLLRKFGYQKSGAIGFAVYIDLLEHVQPPHSEPEVDVLLIYGGDVTPEEVARKVKDLSADDKSVRVQRVDSSDTPSYIPHKLLVCMTKEEAGND